MKTDYDKLSDDIKTSVEPILTFFDPILKGTVNIENIEKVQVDFIKHLETLYQESLVSYIKQLEENDKTTNLSNRFETAKKEFTDPDIEIFTTI